MSGDATRLSFEMSPIDNERLSNLIGSFDAHLRVIERRLGVEINHRGGQFTLIGSELATRQAQTVLTDLYLLSEKESIDAERVNLYLQAAGLDQDAPAGGDEIHIITLRGVVRGRGARQIRYLQSIARHDLNFGIGPAGTGKTYLAVASAIDALERGAVQRIVLVRPAVEAGEKLGFLPGDLAQKIDPYLRPMYDALYEMLGFDKVTKLIERQVIEVAPLAFMRGRTLNESFVILDEAQNTTIEQMKMFLTRIGFGSKAVVTGDVTQIDLPRGVTSGLRDAIDVLSEIDNIAFTFFQARDVVRHPLVMRIVDAYDRRTTGQSESSSR
ncbi:phosphate starvation-inducible protein PhoH [Halothiobacillus diazotrophicus]|uniref:PhoH-like protein n=1 Tax=Halothiobacillus diazotrophicus TaxID=1860122 RepID=A0A191ZEX2_9GAMM|nr:PhoH family protein [Halothiobacillus diazotrophicus]ANJ66426.1 phosphate starvation-inducible protein PhoH [Halothiobacillus diazotrophicus]